MCNFYAHIVLLTVIKFGTITAGKRDTHRRVLGPRDVYACSLMPFDVDNKFGTVTRMRRGRIF